MCEHLISKRGETFKIGKNKIGIITLRLQITWADLHFLNWMTFPDYRCKTGDNLDLSTYPKLLALKERVEKHPKIAEWIEKRPSDHFS